MVQLRTKLNQRIDDKFVPYHTDNILMTFPSTQQNSIRTQLIRFYTNILEYIEKRFDFSDKNYMSVLNVINLKTDITFQLLMDAVRKLELDTIINPDELYEEFCIIRETISTATVKNNEEILTFWNTIFSTNKQLKHFLTIFQYLASIPPSNAATERIFSLCESAWTNNRNKLTVDHLKSELQIKVNFEYSCSEFFEYALKNKSLLRAAKSQNKYSHKQSSL